MYVTTAILTALLFCPLGVLSQATTTAGAVPPDQTIVPFSTLPACAAKCGTLYDVQGSCAPSRIGSADGTTCFCADPRLQPYLTTTVGPCDSVCAATPDQLKQIKDWYVGLCSGNKGATPTTAAGGTQPGTTATNTPAPGSQTNAPATSGSSGNWISSHWQWVIMIVVLALAIIIGWIAACFFRRRYVQRKEREFELRPPAAPWVPGQTGAPGISAYGESAMGKAKDNEATAGMFVSRPTKVARMSEKPPKKWVVKERT